MSNQNSETKMIMHTISGYVTSEAHWRAVFESIDRRSWSDKEFDDADWLKVGHLVEVEKDVDGEWVEV